jgi:nucleoside-diphosphate-sugar epimerase
MRVFVTGASGFIGSAVVPELIEAGHEVVGLARSEGAATTIAALGANVQRGALDDVDSLRVGAEASDGVIHLAFIHDFSQYEHSVHADERAIDAMGTVLEGSDRPFLIASGLGGFASGAVVTERDMPEPQSPRAAAARSTLDFATRGVRSGVVRLPPTVHGAGDHGFVATLVAIAREKGVSGYIGDGANRWPAVHRFDAARLFRLALENAPAGSILHAVGDEGVPTRTIAEIIGRHLSVPVVSVAPEAAGEHFGWLGRFFAFDVPASSALTREFYGWSPTHPGLVDDLERGHYFDTPARV